MSRIHLMTLITLANLNLAIVGQARAEDNAPSHEKPVAASSDISPNDTAGSDRELDTMVVTATRSEISASLAPANVSVITEDTTKNRLNQRIGDALKDVPGIYMRGSSYGTNNPGSSFGSSSFHGISEAKRSLFLVDGLPVNSGASGNVDWNTMNMDDAEQVEYVPGPFSALYGSGAMGGVLNVISKAPTKREGKLTVGAGGGDVDQWGIKGVYRDRLENGLGISLTFNHMDSDNWNDSDYTVLTTRSSSGAAAIPVNGAMPYQTTSGTQGYWVGLKGARPWEQNTASLRLYYDLTPHTQIDGGMAWTRSETGYTPFTSFLTRADNGAAISSGLVSINGTKYNLYETSFANSTPAIEDTRRYFGHLRHDFGGEVKLNVDFQYMENTYDYLTPKTSDLNVTYSGGAGQASSQPNHRIDGNVSLRFPFLWKNRNYLTVGFGANQNQLDAAQKDAVSNWRDENTAYRVDRLGKGESSIYSGYIQDELTIRDDLIAYLGGRYDEWSTSGSLLVNTAYNGTPLATPRNYQYQERSVGQFNPKFGLTWLPTDGYKFFASAGWAFRPPTMLDLYSDSLTTTNRVTRGNPDLKPETMFSWEIGGEIKPFDGTLIAASYFHHYIDDLIYKRDVPNETLLQENLNAGSAEIDGVEIKAKQRLYWDWLHFTATYTMNNSRITNNSIAPEMVGKSMTYLPDTMFSGGLDVDYGPWSGGIIGRYVGKQFTDDLNQQPVSGVFGSYDPYFLVDTRIKYQATKNIDLSFSVNNLLDREYFSFYKQAGRTVYGEISYSF